MFPMIRSCLFIFYFLVYLSFPIELRALDVLDEQEAEGSTIRAMNQVPAEKTLKTAEHLYDDEEFVGFDTKQKKKQQKEVSEVISSLEPPLPPPRTNYYLEICYISFIVAYLINYFFGKRKNEQIATSWASSVSKAFQSNFSKMGEGKNIGITKESQHVYKLKATGRINCIGVQATLQLRKRHDLFSLLLEIVFPEDDTVTIDILMNDDAMETFVFALVRKKDEKKFRKNVTDVPLYAQGTVILNGVPSSLVVCTEIDELVNDLVNPEVQTVLTKYENLVKKLHFSDHGLVSLKHKKSLQFVFKLPNNDADMEGIQILTRMAFYFIDLVAKTKLTKFAQQKATTNRTKALENKSKKEHEQRHELAQQRKLEKMQKQKKALESLSPEAQQKAEEKLQKREMKRRQPKFKVSFG